METNSGSLEVAHQDAKEKANIAQKELELKEEASEHEATKILSTGSDRDNVSYQNAVKEKQLRKLFGSSSGTTSTYDHSRPTSHQLPNP